MTRFFVASTSTIFSAVFFGLNLPWFGAIWAAIAVLNGIAFALGKGEEL